MEGDAEKRKRRQVKTKPVDEVSDYKAKFLKLQKEIKILKENNENLERQLTINSLSSASENYMETSNSIRFSLNDAKAIIPEFDPGKFSSPTASTWIATSFKTIYLWDDRMTLFYATARLAGAASSWFSGRQTEFEDWGKFKTEILKSFPAYIDTSAVLYQIMTRRRKPDECIENFFYA